MAMRIASEPGVRSHMEGVEIKLVSSWSAEDMLKLYRVAGWWSGEEDHGAVERIQAGSLILAFAVAPSGEAVGMGRVISDGASDAYIQDIVVLPEFRRRGIGQRIVAALRDHCLSMGIEWIALVAEPGTEPFYLDLGFKPMEGYVPMRHGGGGSA